MADLDDRIRDLVARAVADAPDAPSLDGTVSPAATRQSSTRWIVGGLAGLSAAAALIALFWVASDDVADEPVTPLAPATTIAPPPPATETTVADTPVDTVADTVIDTVADTVVEVPTPTIAPPPEPAPIEPPMGGAADADVVRAGTEGVVAVSVDGSIDFVTDEPMAVAFRVADGRVFMQRNSDTRDDDADTEILVATPGSTELVVQPMPTPELADVPLRLHDVADIGGDVVLLIEAGPRRCNGFTDCDGALIALRADTGAFDVLYEESMWEASFGRLHLAETGVVFGEFFAEALSMPYTAAVPGTGATPIDFGALGLIESYFDCAICPTAFSIDRNGTTIGWLEYETDDEGIVRQKVIVLATVDGSAIDRFPLTDERTDYPGDGLVPAPWLELVNVAAGPGPSAGWLIVNSQPVFVSDRVAPATIDLDAGVIVSSGFEPGTVVTAG